MEIIEQVLPISPSRIKILLEKKANGEFTASKTPEPDEVILENTTYSIIEGAIRTLEEKLRNKPGEFTIEDMDELSRLKGLLEKRISVNYKREIAALEEKLKNNPEGFTDEDMRELRRLLESSYKK